MNPSGTDQKALEGQGVTEASDSSCTNACTSTTESGTSGRLEELARVLRSLSPDERAKLSELLESESADG